MSKTPDNINRIIVFRYRFIGDTVLTVPFLRNLRYKYPQAQIDILVDGVAGEILRYCPYVDNLIIFDTKKKHSLENYKQPENNSFPGYASYLRKQKYDLAFVLKRSFSSAALAFLSRIKHRVGFHTEYRGLLLTRSVTYDLKKHESECFLDALRAIDIPVVDNHLELWTSENEQASVNSLISCYSNNQNPKIVLNASASNPRKMWSTANFARVVQEMANSFKTQVFFLGSAKDAEVYEQVLAHITQPLNIQPVNLCGKTTILESVELLKQMNIVIGVDSGIMHLAAGVNVPTIAIFGPMSEIKWAPQADNSFVITSKVPCRPCGLSRQCKEYLICLNSISPREVIAIAAKYLNKTVIATK